MKTCPQCGDNYDATQTFCARDGEVLEDSAQDLIGKVLDGQYEIEAFVASGGMGTVYRARHILLGDRVAIKVLLPQFRANAEWLRRFQREGQAARRFSHPNSVAVYDLRTSSDGLVYMVMEFVEGHPLDEELHACGRFSPEQALEILEPVGRVLEAAHRQGVVHRDLKPQNVMVKHLETGGVWIELLDLGIAKLSDFSDAGSPLTVAGQVLGTPYYMSPEQWGERQRDGDPEIDGRTDIYSLGLIFYELVTGARPITAKSLAELRLFHVATMPPRLDAFMPDVPEAFARAVERAMAKDRADRYPDAGAFIEDLRARTLRSRRKRQGRDFRPHPCDLSCTMPRTLLTRRRPTPGAGASQTPSPRRHSSTPRSIRRTRSTTLSTRPRLSRQEEQKAQRRARPQARVSQTRRCLTLRRLILRNRIQRSRTDRRRVRDSRTDRR
jgi:serine/threonine protein kinase